jgi:acetyltransferase-like isoleucine patch superfamily enzyme
LFLLKLIKFLYHQLCNLIAIIIALPFIALGLVSDRINGNITQPSILISRVPFDIGIIARRFYYKVLLLSFGTNVTVCWGSFFQYRKARIGNRVLIGYFNTMGEVDIGDNVLIGGYVNFLSGLEHHSFHDPKKLIWDTPSKGRRMITIGSDIWIGSNSVIGNDIGDRCVVAAGAVVVNKVEPHSLVGGNPAKLIHKI